MEISVQISYYPLNEEFNSIVDDFITQLSQVHGLQIQTGMMSSLITGDYDLVMNTLKDTMYPYLAKYQSVFTITVASACKQCETQ
jgi:uncharacterized protein YqgV (UPF0045/DUF77 family)